MPRRACAASPTRSGSNPQAANTADVQHLRALRKPQDRACYELRFHPPPSHCKVKFLWRYSASCTSNGDLSIDFIGAVHKLMHYFSMDDFKPYMRLSHLSHVGSKVASRKPPSYGKLFVGLQGLEAVNHQPYASLVSHIFYINIYTARNYSSRRKCQHI